jgi:GTP diphosphokinase / guanosine-3',5'-bis(diphosphate) 3'-diphosphatase
LKREASAVTATHDATDALSIVIRAAAFAAHKHRDQRRKDANATPYINHPLELARILTAEGGVTDAATIAAALLHDTIEDTETSAAELDREFGAEIRSIVEEVTDDKALPKADRKRLQVERASHASHKAKLVKLADKIANLRDVATSPPDRWDLPRRQEYFDWAKRVVDRLRGAHSALETVFDAAYRNRPE